MTKLQKSPRKFLGPLLLAVAAASPASAQIQPMDLSAIQAQTQSQLNQQNFQSQQGSLQLQQGMAQDRVREQQLFRPQPGQTGTILPDGTLLQQPPAPPPPPPPPKPKAD